MWDCALGYYDRCREKTTAIRSTQPGVLTASESSSGGGVEIPPMLILSGAVTLEKWAQEKDLDVEILLSTSLTGFSNDELALKWLQKF